MKNGRRRMTSTRRAHPARPPNPSIGFDLMVRDRDFKRLSIAEAGKRKYETMHSVEYELDAYGAFGVTRPLVFMCYGRDNVIREWFRIERNRAIVAQGYRWDGNSPKRVYCGFRLGTPDFEGGCMGSTIECSLFHDCLFQFSSLKAMPFDNVGADLAYLEIGRAAEFRMIDPYYGILTRFSSRSWAKPRPDVLSRTLGRRLL